jgi:hypothetical protein
LAVETAADALEEAVLAVLTAALALLEAVLAVETAALALDEAVLAVLTAAEALALAVLAVLTAPLAVLIAVVELASAVLAVVVADSASKFDSWETYRSWLLFLFRSDARMADPAKMVASGSSMGVSLKIRIATPAAGAVLN